MPDTQLCKAPLDRITDRAPIIEAGTESYHFRRTLRTEKRRSSGLSPPPALWPVETSVPRDAIAVFELILDVVFGQRLSVYFCVRVDQEIKRLSLLGRFQDQVAAHCECDSAGVQMAEVVLAAFRMLPGF